MHVAPMCAPRVYTPYLDNPHMTSEVGTILIPI